MINDKLREIREQTGLNKKRFAEFIGIKHIIIMKSESGNRILIL